MVRRLIALGVAGAISVATGCDSGEPDAETDPTAPVVQLGGPGETNRVLSEEDLAATPSVPGHTADDGLPLLAERMEVSQVAEIEQLQGWLTARGEDPEGFQQHQGMQMPGMLTAEQVAALAAASGEEFDSLFLQSMIRHHEGAVIMVETLLSGDVGGQEPQLFQIAGGIESDQQVEIARMKSLLAELDPAVSGEGG